MIVLPYSPAAEHHRPLTGTYCTYPRRDGQAEFEIALNPGLVTHPSTNRAWHTVTLLIETNALPVDTKPNFHQSDDCLTLFHNICVINVVQSCK